MEPLDRAIDDIRRAEPRPGDIEQSAVRVRAHLLRQGYAPVAEGPGHALGTALRTCADFQALIDDYRFRRLGQARALLLEDHSRTCPACWKLLNQDASTRAAGAHPSAWPARRLSGRARVAAAVAGVAAAVLLAVGGLQTGLVQQILFPADATVTVQTIRGQIVRVDRQNVEALAAGAVILPGQVIRTGRSSGAIVELADGSRVEMGERSELSFVPAGDGVRMRLDGGRVIVQAADQGAGHLYLTAGDMDVAVVGTVFSVSAGTKGARVLVLEGEVRVEHGAVVESLRPGDQYNGAGLDPVSFQDEIAWSQEVDTYATLLEEVAGMRDELEAVLVSPGLRYSSTLMDLAPADTALYAAFPNVARTLVDAYDVFRRRIQENPVTARWWAESAASAEPGGMSIEEMIEHVRTASGAFGSEVVIALGRDSTPVLLAEVTNEASVARLLRTATGGDDELRVVTSLPELLALAGTEGPVASLSAGLLVFSPVPERVIAVVSSAGTNAGFVSDDLYDALRAAYNEGADWLFAADVAALVEDAAEADASGDDRAFASIIGLDSLQAVVVNHQARAEQSVTRASMTFDAFAGGVATWIEAPGPMRSLDFVSPGALGVVAALGRDPVLILTEVFDEIQRQSPEAWDEVFAFQQAQGIDLRGNLAAHLGGEVLVALDGALVPEPSWKVVLEVTNSDGLQQAVEQVVAASNQQALPEGGAPLGLTAESVDGRTFYTLRAGTAGDALHYTYADGYLVAAPARVLVTQALQYRQTQVSLGEAAAFRALLPAGRDSNCSALLYQNLAPVASLVAAAAGVVGDERLESLQAIAREIAPTATCVTAEAGRLVASNQGDLPFDLLTLGGMSTLLDMLTPEAPQ